MTALLDGFSAISPTAIVLNLVSDELTSAEISYLASYIYLARLWWSTGSGACDVGWNYPFEDICGRGKFNASKLCGRDELLSSARDAYGGGGAVFVLSLIVMMICST